MKSVTAFEFDNLKDLLKYHVEMSLVNSSGRKTSNLSRVAKNLGYRSPSILSMLLKGQRIPSDEMVSAMEKSWKLNIAEREFLRLLVKVEREKSKGRDSSDTFERLRRLAQTKNSKTFTVSLNQFSLLKEWYFLVIKQMIGSPGFNEDPKWISRKLRKKITPVQAAKAIEVLLELGLIQRDPVTDKLCTAVGYIETPHNMPSEAIRMHHRGMIDRATEAIEEQSVTERQFNSLTFKAEPGKIPEVREKILNFLRDLNKEYETDNSDSVYQINIQLFEHTRGDL
jgi:uncharacterized protein (TIGR02147 family)